MKIYQTYRQSDEIEGRGPSIPDLAFLHRKHDARYIDDQPGVMGRRRKWSKEDFGDWYIKEIEVLDFDVIDAGQETVRLKMKALAKLTDEDKQILGLM
jgi:hypothetical protein